jgi:hypothetical protein
MQKVTVHRVRVYDPGIGTVIVSLRMVTEYGAKMMGGQIIPGTAVEVDVGLLEAGGHWTKPDFDPHGVDPRRVRS